MNFEKLESKKKSSYVVEQVIGSLKNGVYQVGDKLPSEVKIAQMTGVSRTSVREALSALQIVGVIERRPGDGTYVRKSVNNADITFQVISILEKSESPLEIWEARKCLEACIAELFIERIGSEDLEKLERIIKKMEKVLVEEDYDYYLQLNRDFHFTLAETTENSLLKGVLNSLLEHTNQLLTHEVSRLYVAVMQERSVEKHRNILEAIKKRDKELTRAQIIVHFDELENYLGHYFS